MLMNTSHVTGITSRDNSEIILEY